MFLSLFPSCPRSLVNIYSFNYHLDAQNSQTILLVQGRTTYSFPWVLSLSFRHTFNIFSPPLLFLSQSSPYSWMTLYSSSWPSRTLEILLDDSLVLSTPAISFLNSIHILSFLFLLPLPWFLPYHLSPRLLHQPLNLPFCFFLVSRLPIYLPYWRYEQWFSSLMKLGSPGKFQSTEAWVHTPEMLTYWSRVCPILEKLRGSSAHSTVKSRLRAMVLK